MTSKEEEENEWIGKGFTVFMASEELSNEYYPNPQNAERIKWWKQGFEQSYADCVEHRTLIQCIKELAPERYYLL